MAKPVISLAKAKMHLRVAHELDDDIIRLFADAAMDRALQEIGLAGELDAGPRETEMSAREVRFPLPVDEITAVTKDGVEIAESAWDMAGNFDIGETLTVTEAAWDETAEWVVEWEAGFVTVPAWLELAALFLLGHYYENRSSVAMGQGLSSIEVPMGFQHLCAPHRRVWFA